jgi:hypothetical protein
MKSFREFQIVEAAKTPHQVMLKTLGFPKPNPKDRYAGRIGENDSSYSKHGGYAGAKVVEKLVAKAKASGFVPAKPSHFNSPDGNVVGSGQHFVHPDGHHLEVSKSYGSEKTSNHYSAHLSHTTK